MTLSTLEKGLIAGAAIVLAIVLLTRTTGGQLQHQADSLAGAHAAAVELYGGDTLATDSLFKFSADTLSKPGPIKAAVHKERRSAAKAITTSEQQVTVLRKQLRVATPRLTLFGRLAYSVAADTALLAGDLAAQFGLELRLGPHRSLQAYAEQPLLGSRRRRVGIAFQQDVRLF